MEIAALISFVALIVCWMALPAGKTEAVANPSPSVAQTASA